MTTELIQLTNYTKAAAIVVVEVINQVRTADSGTSPTQVLHVVRPTPKNTERAGRRTTTSPVRIFLARRSGGGASPGISCCDLVSWSNVASGRLPIKWCV